ncbi:sulfatase-like hydrolase/transferase [Panacibacter sp. DH6]|uniref:Sulfatase-like hydrolase/transferase n=1 Tax=Panacibacter microcysteis TaxID=2793269 RepID=A0A931H0K5_9BACT|nr:sulfatase-like hydrolase/transferase [Panacibacter microcysteis]MBG9378693.1 sulfatase-like hydrolase/transferase [Panacibacter microcysteis]
MTKTLTQLTFVLSLLLFSSLLRAQQKPNVIFIVVDDLGAVFEAYGNSDVPTPNFYRLMEHGTMFKQVYCQYALCSPSRATLLSGKRPNSTGVLNNGTSIRVKLGADYKFLPEYFQSLGYYTAKFGKMTCGHEEEIAWNYYYDSVSGDGISGIGGSPKWWVDTSRKIVEDTRSGVFTTAMIRHMQQPGTGKPYFYALGLEAHNEFDPILSAWNKIGDAATQQLLPVDLAGTKTNVYGNGSGNITLPNTPVNDADDIPLPALKSLEQYPPDEWRNIRHAYYAEITQVDDLIGKVMDELDTEDAWKNTVVVFTSDHGIQTGEHNGLWFKQTLFEGALRVPLVVCAPGKPAGIHNSPVELVDLYATLAELCSLPIPADQEGSSLVPLLDRQNVRWKAAAFAQVRRVDRQGSSDTTLSDAVRTTQYHYNSWGVDGEELYDIINDPDEFTNLVTNPQYAGVLDTMRNLLVNNWQGAKPPKYKTKTFYRDADGDTYGTRADTIIAYFAHKGYVSTPGDCNDTKASVNPGAAEKTCNGLDDNCNEIIDEGKVLPKIAPTGSLDICITDSVLLTVSNPLPNSAYQWSRGNVDIAGATGISFTAKLVGNYRVVATNTKAGCSSTSGVTKVTNSCPATALSAVGSNAVTTTVQPMAHTLYPNPSKGVINVQYTALTNRDINLQVTDLAGKTLFTQKRSSSKGANTFSLDLLSLTSGVYYLYITEDVNHSRMKFIIQH